MVGSSSDFPSPRSSMSSEKKSEGLQTFPRRRKKSIDMDVGCDTFWSQQQVLQAPKRSIWYRFFFENKAIHGSWATFTLVHLEHLGIFLATNFILVNSNHSCFVKVFLTHWNNFSPSAWCLMTTICFFTSCQDVNKHIQKLGRPRHLCFEDSETTGVFSSRNSKSPDSPDFSWKMMFLVSKWWYGFQRFSPANKLTKWFEFCPC